MRLKTSNDSNIDEGLINLTPLIDVVFVVLIAFILVAPLLESENVDLAQGGGKEKEAVTGGNLHIYIRKDDSIWLNKRLVSLKELLPLLKDARIKNSAAIPKIFPDRESSFGAYQEVKNSIESAGYPEMDVILKSR